LQMQIAQVGLLLNSDFFNFSGYISKVRRASLWSPGAKFSQDFVQQKNIKNRFISDWVIPKI